MAFAIFQIVLAACGPLFGDRVRIDLLPLIWIAAGSAVRNGSRSGRLVAALLCLVHSSLAIFVAGRCLFAGTGDLSLYDLGVVILVGVWSTGNLILLIRWCDLWSCLPRYSLATLFLVVFFAALGFKGIQWLHQQAEPPAFASASAIERRYSEQIARLRQLAKRSMVRAADIASDNPTNVALFGREEILSAEIETVQRNRTASGILIKSDSGSYRQKMSCLLHRKATAEHPVVNIWTVKHQTGQTSQMAVYKILVVDDQGERKECVIEFDLDMLRDARTDSAPPADAKGSQE